METYNFIVYVALRFVNKPSLNIVCGNKKHIREYKGEKVGN